MNIQTNLKPEDSQKISGDVENYYAQLDGTQSLKTGACCPAANASMAEHLKNAQKKVPQKVFDHFYGCGHPFPAALEGLTALDLGCGTGTDVYMLAQLVGKNGKVIGIDMTDKQLNIAREALPQFKKDNPTAGEIDFVKGFIENMADIPDASIDLVVSNCVLNLSPQKEQVFTEIFRVLKPGGELYFSDVYADRRLDPNLQFDAVLQGECLAGAMYPHDFRRLLGKLGIHDFRVMTSSLVPINDQDIDDKLGFATFSSITYRVFKLNVEDRCEDYGQTATYNGGIAHSPHSFILDDHHELIKGKPLLVCENTAKMLSETRFGKYFTVSAKGEHFGEFDCAPAPTAEANTSISCC